MEIEYTLIGINMEKRFALIMAVAMFCSLCLGAAQMQNVGGEFGRSWLTQHGNKFVSADTNNSNDLWNWGGKPRGYDVYNGQLYPMLALPEYYYPLFMSNTTPILINATPSINNRNMLPVDFMSPELMGDPWFLAQVTGQPVMVIYPANSQGSTLF